ncbi:hypothetical protein ABK040_009381 [Willaertia magna]
MSEGSNNFVQLIDGNGKFTEGLNTFLKENDIINRGLNYNILSVFGPQSSGKSTLLNMLFSTKFPTMNSHSGRYQVTLGACMARASNTKDKEILLMDLEGTDSKERGEENMSFERKISLFALAISEVLLVNMWMQDIGRYNAANYSLLKTVFELNLQLFQKDKTSKTLLLFVIRDHIRSMTDISTLREQILKDIEKIWNSLMKPKQFENSQVTDFFDFEFTSLPHKELQGELFVTEVNEMRSRFICDDEENYKNYLFKPIYKKSVPIDGFEHYANGIWQVIIENKDLDIPTQKEMLAMYRCDEISSILFKDFEKHLNEWQEQIKIKTIITRLGSQAKQIIDVLIKQFKEQTQLYVPEVVERKCKEFQDHMISEIKILYVEQLGHLRTKAVEAFRKHLYAAIQTRIDQGEVIEDFTNTTKQIHNTIVQGLFLEIAQKARYPGLDEEFDYKQTLDLLLDELNVITDEYRQKQVELIVKIQLDDMKEDIREEITNLIDKPEDDLWKKLRKYLKDKVHQEEELLKGALKGFEVSDISKYSTRIYSFAKSSIIAKVKEATSFLSLRLNNRFEELFKRDANGMPRAWQRLDQIKEDYKIARQKAIQMLDIFFLCRLESEALDNIHLHIPDLDDVNRISEFSFPTEEEIRSSLKHVITLEKQTSSAKEKLMKELLKDVSLGSAKTPRTPSKEEGSGIHEETSHHQEEHGVKEEEEETIDTRNEMSIFTENLIMNESACERSYEQFIMRTETIYSEAQRAQILAEQNRSNIPWWIYILLVVLGWDEITSFLKNPFYILVGLLIASYFFSAYIKSKMNEIIQDPNTHPTLALALQFILNKLNGMQHLSAVDGLTTSGAAIQNVVRGVNKNSSPSTPSTPSTDDSVFKTNDTSIGTARNRASVKKFKLKSVDLTDLKDDLE